MSEKRAWKRLTEHLYMFEDTCNVYAVIEGGAAILIDFGSGAVLDHLGDIGVQRVHAVIHTHHHRDQCQGDQRAVGAGIPIFVPDHERYLFEHAELFWASKQLFDMYNVRNTFYSLTKNVPVAGSLEDFSVWSWAGFRVEIVPTPGHTYGSQTFLLTIDGLRVAFTGDLLYAAGKVQTMYDMQYNYGAVDGVEFAILSLVNLAKHGPQVLCPSHGQPMGDVEQALGQTRANLTSFFKLRSAGAAPVNELEFVPVLPHVLAATYACSYFYVITSDSGKALLVDYGAPNLQLFAPVNRYFEDFDRVRFVEHSLDRLRTQYGVNQIEAVLPSHYHDDHINGIPYLQKHWGVECWAYENMREILENGRGELLGCVLPTPIKVHRTFHDGERLAWEGMEFTIHHTPGHADYHMGMFGNLDGHAIAFSGDSLHPLPQDNVTFSLIYRNHVHKTSHQQTARLYQEYKPDILCTGHGLNRDVTPAVYETFARNAASMTRHWEMLLPGEPDFGLEPSWTQIYPYQSLAGPGDTINLQLRMNNYRDRPVAAEVRLVLPEQWTVTPAVAELEIEPDKRATADFRVRIPPEYQFPYPRIAISADVTFDGRYLGQITEATVEAVHEPGHAPVAPQSAGDQSEPCVCSTVSG
jgi:glyoxylase-like metal-dependent hydrolase (beta-lactamase superfamily II)